MEWVFAAALVILVVVFLACALLALAAMTALYTLACITLWRFVFEFLDRS